MRIEKLRAGLIIVRILARGIQLNPHLIRYLEEVDGWVEISDFLILIAEPLEVILNQIAFSIQKILFVGCKLGPTSQFH